MKLNIQAFILLLIATIPCISAPTRSQLFAQRQELSAASIKVGKELKEITYKAASLGHKITAFANMPPTALANNEAYQSISTEYLKLLNDQAIKRKEFNSLEAQIEAVNDQLYNLPL